MKPVAGLKVGNFINPLNFFTWIISHGNVNVAISLKNMREERKLLFALIGHQIDW